MRQPLRSQAGFTLIEVLIALLVLAVGILGAARLVASSEASTLDAELQQVATEEAEQAIEDVRALDYADIGHGTAGLPNGGSPFQSPDASSAEEIVTLASGAGVVPSRSFEVERGGGKPPVTGTIRTYVTWRDEECSLIDVSNLAAVTTLKSRISALQTQLGTLTNPAGTSGLVPSTLNKLTDLLVSVLPPGNRAAELRTELNAIKPLLITAVAQASAAQTKLGQLSGQIDLCDLSAADLAGLKKVLETSSSKIVTLTTQLTNLNSTLTSLSGPLTTLFNNLFVGVCGVLPPVCGNVSSNISSVLNVLKPSGDAPKTVAGQVNTILSDLAAVSFSGLTTTDTTHNTKRITVAVTVDTARDDITPANTVWLSSVVTDPSAGLIISGGG